MWAPDREYMGFWGDRKMRTGKGCQSAEFPLDGCWEQLACADESDQMSWGMLDVAAGQGCSQGS